MTAIDVDSLSLSLGGLPILKDISFQIEEGTTVALLGANGSGKSTLVKAILGLHRHQQGTVSLLDQPLETFTGWDQVGYVPQRASVSLHSTTVLEVVASGTLAKRPLGWLGGTQRTRAMDALEVVGLADQANELYLHLSGGQQQRVLIARGVVNHPRLIIMDEPFAGVDIANQTQIASALSSVSATWLVVLHETDALAQHIDRTLILRGGRLVFDGPLVPAPAHATHEWEPPEHRTLMTGMEPRWIS
ncbi:MAG: ATP-binding cassette domain-containing protein [Propionibacteriaceae bacterium]|nr:ATP-binding cassette domain-containing protein [Propionibacteriaceae bacterium]